MLDAFKDAVIDLAARRLTRADFVRAYPPAGPAGYDVDQLLNEAIASRDSDAVNVALILSALFDVPVSTSLLAHLLLADWHHSHEDLASMLQATGDPGAVPALSAAASTRHAYLEDRGDSPAFARKCTWALADIGTDEARQALEKLAVSDDREIAAYAQKRLDRWEAELQRKRHRPNGV